MAPLRPRKAARNSSSADDVTRRVASCVRTEKESHPP